MAIWAADGYISGVQRKTLNSGPGGALADAAVQDDQVGVYTVPGTVDAQIITRLQYNVPSGGDGDSSWGINSDLTFSGTFTFEALDFALNPGKTCGVSLLLIAADQFDEGVIPTPVQMRSAALEDADGDPDPDPVIEFQMYRCEGGVTSAGGPFGFGCTIPVEDLEPNKKYWLLVYPSAFVDGSDPDVNGDKPVFPALANNDGRALSFWTNRSPLAPVITSPSSGTVVTAGRDITFAFQPNDPDGANGAPNDYRSWSFADMAGIEVQYAPRPTIAVPEPDWLDLPIYSNKPGETPEEGPGWFIEYADAFDKYLGAKALHHTRTMKIRCGGTSPLAGAGALPSGNWQIRMRTFDYGHPMATVRHTDDAVPGFGPTGTQGAESPAFLGDGTFPTTPSPEFIPAENTSPWSESCNVTVTTEVPAPIPVSPINHIAITEDIAGGVTLRWQYRNTHQPSLAQVARQVQIRKRGETDWTDLVSGNSDEHFYNIDTMLPGNSPDPDPVTPPTEYMVDFGFEGDTDSGFETNSPGTLAVVESDESEEGYATGLAPHSGAHCLQLVHTATGSTSYPFRNRIALDPDDKFFSFKGWAWAGEGTTSQEMIIWFLNGTVVDDPEVDYPPFPDILGPLVGTFIPSPDFDMEETGWRYAELLDIPKPPGSTQAWVQMSSLFDPGYLLKNQGDAIDDWSMLGSPTLPVEPEVYPALDLPVIEPVPYALDATTQYEWRVRVADEHHVTSDWSAIGKFWIVPVPGSGPIIVPGETIDGATLGCGTHRIEVYRRGGKRRVGELTQVSSVEWNRLRDDISDAKVVVSGWDVDCGALLAELQTWAYELVIFRDNGYSVDRVWEGPISLITYENDRVTLNAKDVGYYLYRRIIKQEMNDGGDVGGDTVVNRAARIIQNVMAPDDPNVLAYLQVINNDSDAMQYRSLPPWSRTAYEEIDDMAANAGLDYTAVGRAILVWGTKNRIGTLPELRDENLGSSPIVSEYGAQFANVYSVSDGNGVHGEAYRLLLPEELQTSDEIYGAEGEDETYGLVEMLSSSWASQTEEEAGTYTAEGLATIQRSFSEFAERSISDSYPPPVVVRVPDNTTLNPNTVLSIQHLVPGVAIPLRSGGTLRVVKAIQKLDSMKVVEVSGNETISITLSPFNHEDTEIEVTT